MTMPRAEFWRLWAVAAVLIAVFLLSVVKATADTCAASFYSRGHRTASGDRFDPFGLTAAHRSFAFGTPVRVTYLGRSVVVLITDRGPHVATGRCLDLSLGAARALGMIRRGTAHVHLETLR